MKSSAIFLCVNILYLSYIFGQVLISTLFMDFVPILLLLCNVNLSCAG